MMSHKKPVSRKMILAVIVIVIVLAGVGYYYYMPAGTAFHRVPNGGTFVYQTPDEVDSLDPAWDYEVAGGAVLELVYDRLLYFDRGSLKIVPELAERYEASPDGLVYTFHIRKGVTFHDGTALNASAVKFSLDRTILMSDPDGPAWILAQIIKGGSAYMDANSWQNDKQVEMQQLVKTYLAVEGVKVIDDYTVQVTLEYPFSAFPSMLTYGGPGAIISPSFVLAHSEKGWWSSPEEFPPFGLDRPGFHNEYVSGNTCGTGSYRVVEWTKNARIVLERNENYWRDFPKLRRVVFQQVVESGTRLLALFSGDADAIALPAGNIYDVVEKDPWISRREIIPSKKGIIAEVYDLLTIRTIGININHSNPIFRNALSNKNFRYGLSYVFDYGTYINTVINGLGEQNRGLVPQGVLGYDDTLFQFNYDPEQAKGYFLKAKSEGAYDDGLKIAIFYESGNEQRKGACLLLKDGVEGLNVGISMEINEVSWPTYLDKVRSRELPVFFADWTPDYIDPDNYIVPYARSDGTRARIAGYSNATIDAMINQAQREQVPEKRVKLYHEIQRELIDEAIYIWIAQVKWLRVARDWVKGYFFNPTWSGRDTGCLNYMWKEETTQQVAININAQFADLPLVYNIKRLEVAYRWPSNLSNLNG